MSKLTSSALEGGRRASAACMAGSDGGVSSAAAVSAGASSEEAVRGAEQPHAWHGMQRLPALPSRRFAIAHLHMQQENQDQEYFPDQAVGRLHLAQPHLADVICNLTQLLAHAQAASPASICQQPDYRLPGYLLASA